MDCLSFFGVLRLRHSQSARTAPLRMTGFLILSGSGRLASLVHDAEFQVGLGDRLDDVSTVVIQSDATKLVTGRTSNWPKLHRYLEVGAFFAYVGAL
jgi:hypothetical protein